MTINMEIFKQFAEQLPHLGEHAQLPPMTDAERVESARETFVRKLDGRMAVDLESCIHCGHCAAACHFYVGTEDPKYVPIRKLDLLKRVYRRELSPLRWMHRTTSRSRICRSGRNSSTTAAPSAAAVRWCARWGSTSPVW
jgi:Fe-S-cluster-containing dehydrogenase component